jgi:excisionase family DNA binding protein
MGDHIFSPAMLDWLAGELADRLAGRISSGAGDEIGDVYDAARWLGCSVPTVERAVKRGEVPSIKVGRLRRFRRADLLAMNEKGGCDHGK